VCPTSCGIYIDFFTGYINLTVETHTDRHTHTHRQTHIDRHTHTDTHTHRHTHTDRHRHTNTHRQTHTHTDTSHRNILKVQRTDACLRIPVLCKIFTSLRKCRIFMVFFSQMFYEIGEAILFFQFLKLTFNLCVTFGLYISL